jgi:hypothetical protein
MSSLRLLFSAAFIFAIACTRTDPTYFACVEDSNCPFGYICGASGFCVAGARVGDAGAEFDAGTDAGPGNMDGGADAVVDGGTDAGVDGGTDAGLPWPDAGPDAGRADGGMTDAGAVFSCGSTECSCNGLQICSSDQCSLDFLYSPWTALSDIQNDSQYTVSCTDAGGECIVPDSTTGLVWQQTIDSSPCPADAGLSAAGFCTQPDAVNYCASLSYGGFSSGWRLPSYPELFSLVSMNEVTPAIDSRAFPNTPASVFWTSTPYAATSGVAWGIDFGRGNANYGPGTLNGGKVRCVR